ncbi:cupin domain-containing protein [Paraburkholderia kirstenboschensis]|uniref:Cupin domain-containing protein n=1 Tax=Paraburkholderia kirstenboschensis TaxID=1245436 RepID=A0ABZ0EE63_9BURK|nr:cupin domain-containing protein [Paraburkholderia kirstenboschensis]WOD14497.1 cupin domain-containing protein [Paraburkholderia kirstenboschensis]
MLHLTKAARQFAETSFPGIRSCVVWGENGEGADIVEFKAGARFPLHDHEAPEQVLMLSRRIRFGNVVLSAGDYLKIGPGEEHDAEALEDSLFFLAHEGGIVLKG